MKFETHTLKNGLRVVLVPVAGAESVTVMVMSGTGSRYESERENGLAHFLEHMLFKGTKRRPTAKAIAEELDGVGGVYNAFTSKDHTAYYAKVDKRHFTTAFDVVSDIFLNATLPPREITRERGAILEEINMYEDMPMRGILDEFDMCLFGSNDPLGRTILGPKENIKHFTRREFMEYLTRNYVAGNSAISVTGAFSKSEVLAHIKKVFAGMRAGAAPAHARYTHEQSAPRVHIKYKETDQTHFVLGLPSYPHHHKDEAVVEVLSAILGGGMSSRLFSEVRERRGLAYYVKAENDQYDDTGNFIMRAGVSHKNLIKALKTTLAEVRKLKKANVSKKELTKVKEHVKGSMALALDTTDALAQYTGYGLLVRHKLETVEDLSRAIEKVTAAEIRRVVRDLFKTERLNLAVVGPHKNKKALTALLKV
ncbi:MAG: pitrilysin family protein [bacterium]|nr:pitrilysin family protein [bacterium]